MNDAKGIRAECEIRRDSGNSQVYFLRVDLTLVSEAHRLADEVKSRCDHLHYLVHSAGMVRGRRALTAEGVESNFAVNYLSRFALTSRLLPLLQAASMPGRSARTVLVGGAVRRGPIHYQDISLAKRFTNVRAIRQFQQANNVFTGELARRPRLRGRQRRPFLPHSTVQARARACGAPQRGGRQTVGTQRALDRRTTAHRATPRRHIPPERFNLTG